MSRCGWVLLICAVLCKDLTSKYSFNVVCKLKEQAEPQIVKRLDVISDMIEGIL